MMLPKTVKLKMLCNMNVAGGGDMPVWPRGGGHQHHRPGAAV